MVRPSYLNSGSRGVSKVDQDEKDKLSLKRKKRVVRDDYSPCLDLRLCHRGVDDKVVEGVIIYHFRDTLRGIKVSEDLVSEETS